MRCGEYERLLKPIINSTSHYKSKMIHTVQVPANCKTLHIEIGQPIVTNSVVEAPNIPTYKTDGIVKELQSMLDDCEKTNYVDERCEISEKIFTTILKNPEILLYEPYFRKVIINKMAEIEETIKQRVKDVKNADYSMAMHLVRDSLMIHIRNTRMRDQMLREVDQLEISIIMYSAWANGSNIKEIFRKIRTILHNIKSHPLYVADVE